MAGIPKKMKNTGETIPSLLTVESTPGSGYHTRSACISCTRFLMKGTLVTFFICNNVCKSIPITSLLEYLLSNSLVLYVVPVLNPDGYAYSWTKKQSNADEATSEEEEMDMGHARMWRKNRRPLGFKEEQHSNVTEQEICTG